jgi:hypothetical protein
MEAKRQPGAAPVASPLLSWHSSDPYGVSHVFVPPVVKSPREGVFIVGFRSRQFRRVQGCIETTLKG